MWPRTTARSWEGHRPCTLLPDSSCVERVLGSECVTAVVHTVHPVHLAATPVARSCYVVTVVEPDPVTACTEGCKARNLRFRGESGRESLHTRCYWTSTT